jgi:hypothetical protein
MLYYCKVIRAESSTKFMPLMQQEQHQIFRRKNYLEGKMNNYFLTGTFIALCCVIIIMSGCAGPRLQVEQIVDMSKVGDSDKDICTAIWDSGTIYHVEAAQVTELHNQGVSDKVIDCMQETYTRALVEDAQLADGDNWESGPGGWWYRTGR